MGAPFRFLLACAISLVLYPIIEILAFSGAGIFAGEFFTLAGFLSMTFYVYASVTYFTAT